MKDLTNNKIALVTGANKGIGFEVAKQLASAGMRVYLGARDRSRGEEATARLKEAGHDVRSLLLDLSRPETVEAAEKQISEESERLDVLVNNAGIVDAKDGSPGTADLDAVRRIFDTNLFGTIRVTQIMLPLIKRSKEGRIVNVSSGLGSLTLNSDPASEFYEVRLLGYNSSKAALNMFTVQLAGELREAGILVNSADPGYTATDLNGHRGHQTIEQGAQETVRLATLPEGGPTAGFFDLAGARPW